MTGGAEVLPAWSAGQRSDVELVRVAHGSFHAPGTGHAITYAIDHTRQPPIASIRTRHEEVARDLGPVGQRLQPSLVTSQRWTVVAVGEAIGATEVRLAGGGSFVSTTYAPHLAAFGTAGDRHEIDVPGPVANLVGIADDTVWVVVVGPNRQPATLAGVGLVSGEVRTIDIGDRALGATDLFPAGGRRHGSDPFVILVGTGPRLTYVDLSTGSALWEVGLPACPDWGGWLHVRAEPGGLAVVTMGVQAPHPATTHVVDLADGSITWSVVTPEMAGLGGSTDECLVLTEPDYDLDGYKGDRARVFTRNGAHRWDAEVAGLGGLPALGEDLVSQTSDPSGVWWVSPALDWDPLPVTLGPTLTGADAWTVAETGVAVALADRGRDVLYARRIP